LKTGGVVFYARLSAKDIYLAANSTGDSVVGQENQAYIWTVTKGDRSDQYFITFVFPEASRCAVSNTFVLVMGWARPLVLPAIVALLYVANSRFPLLSN
jgi:hypothetical protein